MAESFKEELREYRATKVIVADKLSVFIPGLTGPDLLAVGGSVDATFKFKFRLPETISNPHVEVIQADWDEISVTPQFLVTNLINLLDGTITASQLKEVTMPDSDPLRVYFHLKIVELL